MKALPNPFETPSERVWNTKTETETRDEDTDREETRPKPKQKTQTARLVASRAGGIVAWALERQGGVYLTCWLPSPQTDDIGAMRALDRAEAKLCQMCGLTIAEVKERLERDAATRLANARKSTSVRGSTPVMYLALAASIAFVIMSIVGALPQ